MPKAPAQYDIKDLPIAIDLVKPALSALSGSELTVEDKFILNPKTGAKFRVTIAPDRANNSVGLPIVPDAHWLVVVEPSGKRASLINNVLLMNYKNQAEAAEGRFQGCVVQNGYIALNMGWAELETVKLIHKHLSLSDSFGKVRSAKRAVSEPFVHLHVHSQYSMLDGVPSVMDLALGAKNNGQPGIALTDHGVMYGLYKFWKACKDVGVKPILGCEIYLVDDPSIKYVDREGNERRFEYHQTILAMNQEGYANLCELVSEAAQKNYYYVPRIGKSRLLSKNAGLICLSGCFKGPVAFHLQEHPYEAQMKADIYRYDPQHSLQTMIDFKAAFGDRYYAEVQENDFEQYMKCVPLIHEIADKVGVPLVKTNDAHYVNPEDAYTQSIISKINKDRADGIGDGANLTGPYYLKQRHEFVHPLTTPAMLDRTCEIMERCNVSLEAESYLIPGYDLEGDSDWADFVKGTKR